MDNIYLDDWNRVFAQPPAAISQASVQLLQKAIPYHDAACYEKLKSGVKRELGSIGGYESICQLSGSQAVEKAILISQKQMGCRKLFKMKGVYHGINMWQWEAGECAYPGLTLEYFSVDSGGRLDTGELGCEKNAIILLEPLLLFARYGGRTQTIIRQIRQVANDNGHVVIVDEVRSGVFKTGMFLLSERFEGFQPHVICFAKGLGLGVAVSVASFHEDYYSTALLRGHDRVKSNLSLSALALQRSVDLLEYIDANRAMLAENSRRIGLAFQSWGKTGPADGMVRHIHVSGCTCALVFDPGVSASKRRSLRMLLLAEGVIVRHFEDNLLYLNCPVDARTEEVESAAQAIEKYSLYLLQHQK